MAKIYYENSADLALVRAKKVAVFGYGSQGHAHALNLRDSGVEVRIALEPTSRSRTKAREAGLRKDAIDALLETRDRMRAMLE